MWKGSGYSCTDRVGYLLDHFSLTEGEAKTNLMKQGHCPESRVVGYIGAVQTSHGPKEPSPIGDMFSCRQKPKPGENSFDNFCGHCKYHITDPDNAFPCHLSVHILIYFYNGSSKKVYGKDRNIAASKE